VKWFGIDVEYKLSYAGIETDLVGGGSLKVQPGTNYLILGFSFSIGRRD
jgi:hypothetical protein